jgi:hypothetical protein
MINKYIINPSVNKIFLILLIQSIGLSQESDPLGLIGDKWYHQEQEYFTRIVVFESYKKGKYKGKYFAGHKNKRKADWALEEDISYKKIKAKIKGGQLYIGGRKAAILNSKLVWDTDEGYFKSDPIVFTKYTEDEMLIFRDEKDGKISHFCNPELLQYPSSYRSYRQARSAHASGVTLDWPWGGWFTSQPFDNVSKIKGSVFNKQTGITFDYSKEIASGIKIPYNKLINILFDDIPNPATGTPPAGFKDLIEPEIIENQYKNYERWFPIQYLSDKNIMLFGFKRYDHSMPIFYLLDLNQGTVKEIIQKNGYHFLFSNRFLGNYLVASKQGFLYYDYMNDIELSRYTVKSKLPNKTVEFVSIFDRNMVNDENLWLRILSDNFFISESGRWVKFGYVDQDSFHYVYSVNETDENKIMFEIISNFKTISEIDEN